MSGRVLLLDGETPLDVFDVVDHSDGVIRARSAYLFEIGEQLDIRIEQNGSTSRARARVRAHVTDGKGKITELEVTKL